MPHVTYSLAVEADIQDIWRVFLDKIEHPERYMALVKETRFLEDTETHILREIVTEDMALQEKITLNENMGLVDFALMNHPLFEGSVSHQITPALSAPNQQHPLITLTMDWQPKNDTARQMEDLAAGQLQEHIEEAARHIKSMAEHLRVAASPSSV
ncbi:MAG: AtaL-like protein [Candidatus Melainabacteria bacterium]